MGLFAKVAWVALLSVIVFSRVEAMSLLDIGKSCVFSEVVGVVLLEGKPVSGAVIKRQVEYQEKESDQTTTDQEGRFTLSAMYHRSAVKLLPAEFVAAQSLVVEYQGKEYKIWSNTKRKSEENAELGGKALHLKCELTADLALHREFGSILRTNCTW